MDIPDFGKPHFINVQDRYIDIKKIKGISTVKNGEVEYSFSIYFIDEEKINVLRNVKNDHTVVWNGEISGYVSRRFKEDNLFSIPEYRVEDTIDHNNPKIEIEDAYRREEYDVDDIMDYFTYHFDCTITYNKVKDLRDRIVAYVNEYQHDDIPKFDFED